LLEGVTGSGKTEIYLQLAEQCIKDNKQVLVLIPEIGLTHQFVARFKNRLDCPIVVLNSAVSDSERKQGWLLAQQGLAKVIIGTRSAVFTPLTKPGMIIIDEEHDSSYKQQDGLRYHARQVALIRAKRFGIPVLMGSATPSVDSLYQVQQQRYQHLTIQQRATGATLPALQLVDSRQASPEHGLTTTLLNKIETHLSQGNQVMLFINRRGFAPVLMCHDCGWQASCRHCDARQVVHQHQHILFCHHCGFYQQLITTCPECHASTLHHYGAGTERIEQDLTILFPDIPVLRIDRDSTQRVNAMSDMIAEINTGEPCILVGTQMLAKGHDFHDVTLVGVLDADQGLFSADFRATENLAQMIVQVTGRAGRGQKQGEVVIQSAQPEHAFWQLLLKQGYAVTAQQILQERLDMGIPPASHWIVIRAEAIEQDKAMALLEWIQQLLQQSATDEINILGPVPAVMARKAGRFRAQLLLMSTERKVLHQLLDQHITAWSQHKLTRQVRWSIDVDPLDLI
jgi:primosomal protein N' (replication factor Y)